MTTPTKTIHGVTYALVPDTRQLRDGRKTTTVGHYGKPLGKGITELVMKHAHMLESVEYDPENNAEGDGPSYWLYLRDDWICADMECHTIHEDTIKLVKEKLETVEPARVYRAEIEGLPELNAEISEARNTKWSLRGDRGVEYARACGKLKRLELLRQGMAIAEGQRLAGALRHNIAHGDADCCQELLLSNESA